MRRVSGVRELSTSSSHYKFISSLPCYLGIQLNLGVHGNITLKLPADCANAQTPIMETLTQRVRVYIFTEFTAMNKSLVSMVL